jgi:sirohydrochlorin cobaltochelatase
VAVADPLGSHPALIALTLERAAEAAAGLVAMNCDSCQYRVALRGFEHVVGMAAVSDHHHGLRGSSPVALVGVPRAVDDATPGMGAAELRFRPDGTVHWGAMWQDFCELALTGGPPVRNTMLTSAVRFPTRDLPAHEVAAEIARGIAETTALAVTDWSQPGWLGFACDDERMAVWVAAAIIIENVVARFAGRTVYVPVAADWRLNSEIKNIITAVAKTCHYWAEHRPQMPALAPAQVMP